MATGFVWVVAVVDRVLPPLAQFEPALAFEPEDGRGAARHQPRH